jgi:GMP synthase-like glutamine amidotransferase
MILIVHNRSTFIEIFKPQLTEKGIPFVQIHHDQPIDVDELKSQITGIILTGGKGDPYTPLNLTADFVTLMNFEVPILGFCLSHEIIAVAYGGLVERLPEYQDKEKGEKMIFDADDELFEGIDKQNTSIRKRHHSHVYKLPKQFSVLAHSAICPFEIIRHKTKPIYGFQGHPELLDNPNTKKIMENFLKICGYSVLFEKK